MSAVKMNCQERDQDLLMSIHGQLTPAKGFATDMHLRRCPRCQERRDKFIAVSGYLSRSFKSQTQSYVPGRPARPASLTPRLSYLIAVLLLAIGLAVFAGVSTFAPGGRFPQQANTPPYFTDTACYQGKPAK